jgi:Cu/Ag efflux pump CusA
MTSFARVHHVAAHGLRHKRCASGIWWRRSSPFSFGACTRDRARQQGFCLVSALAVVQAWLVASEVAKARWLCGNIRNACYRGAQAKVRAVSLVGLCAIVGVLPLALIGESSGAQGRFATVMLGGVLFSTIAALTVLPVVIAQIAECDR